jgi:hypothetical protein
LGKSKKREEVSETMHYVAPIPHAKIFTPNKYKKISADKYVYKLVWSNLITPSSVDMKLRSITSFQE